MGTMAEQRALLVRGAEIAADDYFRDGRRREFNKTQLSQLVAVCQEALCAEEIENYLRYQAGRRVWPATLVKAVIDQARLAMKDIGAADKVTAWRHYATYFKRAFIYRLAV